MQLNKITEALLGVAIGDAVGVPYEFKSAEEMENHPAKGMIGYGTYNQPAGTWSDDSSLTFCLAESLLGGYNLADMATKFSAWKNRNYWSARGELFDIGITTANAINRLDKIVASGNLEELTLLKYQGDEFDNGNGSLMRIMPLLCYIKDRPIEKQFEIIWNVSALTHRHIRAAMSCLIFLTLAENLLTETDKGKAYTSMRQQITAFWQSMNFSADEQKHFTKVIAKDIRSTSRKDLRSGGYVIESIEASLWCFLCEDTYESTILSAVNLGHDTDTTAAIAGGLAGLHYGQQGFPELWLYSLARMEDIIDLGHKLHQKYF
ncbi:MAG: ADP-ribosylglycohydrolase family protein [Bacteroidota bacterium]